MPRVSTKFSSLLCDAGCQVSLFVCFSLKHFYRGVGFFQGVVANSGNQIDVNIKSERFLVVSVFQDNNTAGSIRWQQ